MRKFKSWYYFVTVTCWISLEGMKPKKTTWYRRTRGPYVKDAEDPAKLHYRPNQGYEPYWYNGEWVFEHDPKLDLLPTTAQYKVCGGDCNPLYYRIGKVCAHKSNESVYHSCRNYSDHCSLHNDDELVSFITYDHYCLFLDARCSAKPEAIVNLVHTGACINHSDTFKPIFHPQEPIDRVQSYMDRLLTVLSTKTRYVRTVARTTTHKP